MFIYIHLIYLIFEIEQPPIKLSSRSFYKDGPASVIIRFRHPTALRDDIDNKDPEIKYLRLLISWPHLTLKFTFMILSTPITILA